MQKNKRQNVKNVRSVIRQTLTGYTGLSLGILLAVAGAIVTALLPPWILGSIVDTITAGNAVPQIAVIQILVESGESFFCPAVEGITGKSIKQPGSTEIDHGMTGLQ